MSSHNNNNAEIIAEFKWNKKSSSASGSRRDQQELKPVKGKASDRQPSVKDQVVYTDIDLPHRIIRNQFVSPSVAGTLLDFILSHESEMRRIQKKVGSFSFGVAPILKKLNCDLKARKVEEETPEQIQKREQITTFIDVIESIKSTAEKHFNMTLGYFQITLHKRIMEYSNMYPPFEVVPFHNIPFKKFILPPHVDNSAIYSSDTTVYSVSNSALNSDFQYTQVTAVLYLHTMENEGGQFMFVNVPESQLKRMEVSPNISFTCKQRSLGDCNVMHRDAFATIVEPDVGKLVLFTSGPENIHAVTEITGSAKRLNIILLFSRIDNLSPRLWVRDVNTYKECP